MNILVCPHELIMGGSQINAIELAAAVRDRGHKVTISAPEGPLVSMIEELGLDYLPMPPVGWPATIGDARYLLKLSRQFKFDLIHAYELRPSILSALGPNLFHGVPVVMTILAMEIPYAIPRHVPLIVGTRELKDAAPKGQNVLIMEPPIDTAKNRSGDIAAARRRWSFSDDDIVAGVICRLTPDLEKVQGVLAAIEAVGEMPADLSCRLLVVGDGSGMPQVREAADSVNTRLKREAVIVTGQMLDPTDAYDACDIILGMGSSAMKGLAFSKPLVVQGTRGFWRLLDEDTVDLFLFQGWFGHGGNGVDDLKPILVDLARDRDKRLRLGRLGRDLVQQRFSLDSAADRIIEIYERTISERHSLVKRLPAVARLALDFARFRGGQVLGRLRDRYAGSRA